MLPNIYIQEQFMRERMRERQCEAAYERMLAQVRKPRQSVLQQMMKSLAMFFV